MRFSCGNRCLESGFGVGLGTSLVFVLVKKICYHDLKKYFEFSVFCSLVRLRRRGRQSGRGMLGSCKETTRLSACGISREFSNERSVIYFSSRKT